MRKMDSSCNTALCVPESCVLLGRLTADIGPSENNPRNSEGAFIRAKNGDILFAYSKYSGESSNDHAPCDIALLRSSDEGESWIYDKIIARAEDFGTQNLMSVSSLTQLDGSISFYFLIKETDGSSSYGRVTSPDGDNFYPEDARRCGFYARRAYYVINNDRILRTSDGKLLLPASRYDAFPAPYPPAVATILISEDDGISFRETAVELRSEHTINASIGLEEPGIIETEDGLYFWFRTLYGCQYFSTSRGLSLDFTEPLPSPFTSPRSPMQIKRIEGEYFAVYNPIPVYNGRAIGSFCGRTPIVIRRSADNVVYGEVNEIEDEFTRGFCYPAIFKTNDGCLLLSYCRGDKTLGESILSRTGINKIPLSMIK
jgi:hypothetical protein